MKEYIIGIDTGGTFTDAVLLKESSGEVCQTVKTPTTHHRLSEGIARSLEKLLSQSGVSSEAIRLVSISSTLATNAVVENRGARVAVFVIGYVKHFRLPVKAVLFAKGGHAITGEEEEPLDLEYLVSVIEKLREEVDAFGVCSAMSIKNPAHELVTEKAISMISGKPVFCSHRISDLAGMQERAATAGLHAKLMPLMQDFIAGVNHAMELHSLAVPIAIIGGNCQPIAAEKVVEYAGMTVASGPACTTSFGAHHGPDEAIIVDVGGTTTDITMVKNGHPLFSNEGSTIGSWKTHVEAIDIFTKGIGGDSHVVVDDKGALSIGPARVTPLALSDGNIPIVEWLGPAGKSKHITPVIGDDTTTQVSSEIFTCLLQHGASTPTTLKERTGLGGIVMEKELEHLQRLQIIKEIGFTPTDALHVLGLVNFGNGDLARQGATLLGKYLNLTEVAFATLIVDQTVEAIENCVLEFVTNHYWQKTLTSFISTRNDHPVLEVNFGLKIPMVGIGAASKYFLPQVAERLRTSITFPENYHVGNAIGAAILVKDD